MGIIMTYSAVEYQNNSDLHFSEGQAHRSFLLYLLTMLAHLKGVRTAHLLVYWSDYFLFGCLTFWVPPDNLGISSWSRDRPLCRWWKHPTPSLRPCLFTLGIVFFAVWMELCLLDLVFLCDECFACVCMYIRCVQCLWRSEDGTGSPGTRVMGRYTASKLLFYMSLKVKTPQKSLKEAKDVSAQQGETVTPIPSWIESVGHLRGDWTWWKDGEFWNVLIKGARVPLSPVLLWNGERH